MPSKKSTKQYRSEVEFVEVKLLEQAKREMLKDERFMLSWPLVMDKMCASGYKVVLKDDTRSGAGMCMLQSAEYTPDDLTTIWVFRSSTVSGALLKFSYYLYISDMTLPQMARRLEAGDDDDNFFAVKP